MPLRRSAEDYLEAIYVLSTTRGMVRSVDVAHHMEYSKPSVSRAVTNLRGEGYLDMLPDGTLQLTGKGLATARAVYERHTILTALFTSIGVSEKTAAEDACRVEHAISAETFARLKATHAERLGTLAPPGKSPRDSIDRKKK